MSTFSGLNTGLSSLYAQRRGLELTGHNIANANTEGYSRQRVTLQANPGSVVAAVHSRWNGTGNGVTVSGAQRMHDVFLDARALHERGNDASLRGNQVLLSRVESILTEPGDGGIQSQLSDFWSGWDDVANQPTDLAARSQLLERAETLTSGLNRAVERLGTQWTASHEQLGATVAEVNALAASVADYNAQILKATRSGLSPNDLADQRDVLVQQLGQLAGVSARPVEGGAVDVYLGGTALVRGTTSERLQVQGDQDMRLPASAVAVGWERDGYPAQVGGASGAMLSGLNDVLPRYAQGVTALGDAVARQVNNQHGQGFDQDGNPGGDFFVRDAAGRLTVALSGPRELAASATGGDRNGANAATLAELSNLKDGPETQYRQLIVGLGVEAQAANRRVDIQANILYQVDAAREAESGVNLDEEMANMLTFQRGYEGAARFMTAVDQVLDTLINRTGLAGR